MSNEIRIENLEEKIIIQDDNLIIIEDEEDTKKSTISQLKNNFNGDSDDPSDLKFYSSKRVNEIKESIDIRFSSKVNKNDFDQLQGQVTDIISNNKIDPNKDQELIQARNGFSTLSERLNNDRSIIDTKYNKKIKESEYGNPVRIYNHEHEGYIDIEISGVSNKEGSLIITSDNLLDMSKNTINTSSVEYNEDGFKYTQIMEDTSRKITIDLDMDILEKGSYFLYSSIDYSDQFIDKGKIYLYIKYTDGTLERVDYDQKEKFMFTAQRSFNGIKIEYHDDDELFQQNAYVIYKNIMITKKLVTTYIPYHKQIKNIPIQEDNYITFNNIYNKNYIYNCNISGSIIVINYYNNYIDTEYLYNSIRNVEDIINNNIDKCGLIEEYGKYIFFDNVNNITNDCEISKSNKFSRNGKDSLEVKISQDAKDNPIFYIEINPENNNIFELISLMYYIDKDIINTFTDNDGISIRMTSDPLEITPSNYYSYNINRKEMIQGWNCTKKKLSEFSRTGLPDINNINRIFIEINRNDNINGKTIYFNSIVLNQKMKPTLLLNFNSVYSNSINYTYPLLDTKEIPFTVFLNNSTPVTDTVFSYLVKLWISDKCDIGTYGCHPDKELLTKDDNEREQYLSLLGSKKWIEENVYFNPISYSAPYGNLRPITIPILRNLNYGISRTSENVFCSFFSNKDFSMPSFSINNLTTAEDIKNKIDYAIETGQTISLFTNDITEYGDESNANKIMFENIIDYIVNKVNDEKLQCLTFKDFYNKCIGGK